MFKNKIIHLEHVSRFAADFERISSAIQLTAGIAMMKLPVQTRPGDLVRSEMSPAVIEPKMPPTSNTVARSDDFDPE